MQVTDKSVSVAIDTARKHAREVMGVACEIEPETMRAALEAALGGRTKCDSDLLKHLHVTAELTAQGMKNSKPEDYLEGKAAACIEDLAGALKELLRCYETPMEWENNDIVCSESRATLERWGLK